MAAPSAGRHPANDLADAFLERFDLDTEPHSLDFFFSVFAADADLSWFQRISPLRRKNSPSDRWILGALDIVLSFLFLILLSPLILTLILVIRLESPGPSIFVQERLGKDGKVFHMLKLRSMRDGAGSHAVSLTDRNDPRVTRVGQFIRRHHIDEVLQFVNVFKREMSIVGPRPEIPALARFSTSRIHGYDRRNRVLPGITGLAQVVNGYGQNLGDLRRSTALDLYAIEHQSVGNYLRILLKTVRVVLEGSKHS